MKNLLLLLLVLPLLFSCGDSLDKELTSKMLEDGYTGQGTYTSADGDKWVGEWKDGKAHGQGTLTYAKGEKYLGEWMNGMMHGQGTYTNAKGEKYVGEYMDAKMNGQGTYTSADGTIEKGLWQNDVFVGQSSKIIGTPIKIGNLEVAQNDFPKGMAWIEAKNACANLGSGWRLPTQDELNLICENYKKINSAAPYDERYLIENYDRIISNGTFWSSTGSNYKDIMWQHTYFFNLHARFNSCYDNYDNKRKHCKVRAVRSF